MSDRRSAMIVSQGRFDSDPRHSYWTSSLRVLGYEVVEVEILDEGCPRRLSVQTVVSGSRWTVRVNRFAVSESDSTPPVETATGRYVASTDSLIYEASRSLTRSLLDVDVLVAIDLLVARNVIALGRERPTVYDAHEVFVEAYEVLDVVALSPTEGQFWKDVERQVCLSALAVVTVSPGLAQLMERETGITPWVIPNYPPIGAQQSRSERESGGGPVRFVFVGRADPFRGLERLVAIWDFDESIATLDIYIPDSPEKRKLCARAAAVRRSFAGPIFRDPVLPRDIPSMLAAYDVGIIPYEYPYPYSEASPNKFGEYLAAGLSVLVNGDGFVSRVVQDAALGVVFDWRVDGAFSRAVDEICEGVRSGRFAERSSIVFRREMNWDVASRDLLERIARDCGSAESAGDLRPPPNGSVPARPLRMLRSLILSPIVNLVRRSPMVRLIASHAYGFFRARC